MSAKKRKKTMWIILTVILVFLCVQWLFIGYRFSFGPFRSLGDIRMSRIDGNAESYNMKYVQGEENSPFAGKKVLFLGSSVTYGAASLREGIPEYFARRWECDITKEAVSGTKLIDDSRNSYVSRLLNNVDASEDYALTVCQLSTNDASKNAPLGEIAEGTDRDTFDTRTVSGAVEYIISYCSDTWHCPVVFYTGSRYESPAYAAMVERLLEIRDKWGIGVLDLWTDDDFNNISPEQRKLFMYDDIHPTRAGYRDWWCPALEKQLDAWLGYD